MTGMIRFVAASLAGFLLGLVLCHLLTPLAAVWARRRGWVDLPAGPLKIHHAPVPRAGGPAMALSFFASIGVIFAVTGEIREDAPALFGLWAAATASLAAGMWDDARGASPAARLLIESGGGLVVVAAGNTISLTGVAPLDAALTVVAIVVFANAFNLIDGIDGLAGGIGAVAAVYLALLAASVSEFFVLVCAAALAGSCLGFVRHNLSSRKVFLGDGGSLFAGTALAVLAIRVGRDGGGTPAAFVTALLVLGIPALDTLLAVVRRIAARRSIFAGDRSHLYDMMIDRGFSHRSTLAVFLASGAVLGTAVLTSWRGLPPVAGGLWTAAGLLVVVVILRRTGLDHIRRREE